MILKPIQLLYEGLSNLKNFLYNYNFIKKTVIGIPVLSVGNLSVGGTGKTPCVCFLAQTLLEKKMFRSIGIVSRSYKTALKSPQKVDLTRPQAAQIYGDEPCLLQKKLPACSVWSGPQKYLTAKLAVTQETFDLIIVDDGFSHRKLHRHFDLVLIDVTAPLSEYQVLPQGRLREPLSQLHRAHALLLTKTNLVEQSKTQQIIDLLLQQKNISKNNIYLAHLQSDIGNLNPAVDELYIFCGLAHPASLKTSLVELGFTILEMKSFPDHYNYSDDDLNSIYNLFLHQKNQNPKLRLVTTSKDAIKFLHHPIHTNLDVIDYQIKILDNIEGSLLEKISHCL